MPTYKIAWFWSTVFRDVQIQCLNAHPAGVSRRRRHGAASWMPWSSTWFRCTCGYLEYRFGAWQPFAAKRQPCPARSGLPRSCARTRGERLRVGNARTRVLTAKTRCESCTLASTRMPWHALCSIARTRTHGEPHAGKHSPKATTAPNATATPFLW